MNKVWILLSALLAAASPLPGASTGDDVVVIYNSRMPESRSVADYYARHRKIPASQVFGFSINTNLTITRAEYRESIEEPLAEKLQDKKFWRLRPETIPATNGRPATTFLKVRESRIRYVVLCYGVPARIARDPNLKEAEEEQMRPELRRNEAAVDTELALLPFRDAKPPLSGPLQNPLFACTNSAGMTPTNGVLMVTRLDGPSASIARGLVDKALQAESIGLWGRAYVDLRNTTEPGYKVGDEILRNTAAICRQLGFDTSVDERPETYPPEFPMSQIAIYAGWYDPNASGPFTRAKVEFMPGAFAYHLHSFSAADLRSTTQNWVGPLLAHGATATMGCVDEPYLGGTPDIAVFVSRLIFHGMTFGEAAYAAQPVLSWQTTIVGDPLYCPFGKPAQQRHTELETSGSPLVEWSYLRIVDLNLARGMTPAMVTPYLEQLELTKRSAVLTEKLADLYAAQGKPSSAIDTYARALHLDPSPQQRVRLRLTLAEKLVATDRAGEAFDDYEKLLAENPDYPAKLELYRTLESLAQKLNRKDAQARYEELVRELTPPPAKS